MNQSLFVRQAAEPYSSDEKPSLSDLPKRDFKGPKLAPAGVVDPNYDPNEFELHPNVRRLSARPPQPWETTQLQIPFGGERPAHLDPSNPGGPQWQPNGSVLEDYVKTPNNQATMDSAHNRAHVYGPGAGPKNRMLEDPLTQSLPGPNIKNELENQLALDTGTHHAESPGRHRANKTSDLNDGLPGGTVQIPTAMQSKPRHLNPVDPNLGKPNNWITHPNNTQQSILTPNGTGSVIPYPNETIGLGNNFHNGNPVDTIQPNLDSAKAEVEKNLVNPNDPAGRHRALGKKQRMSFDEDEFTLGYTLAENNGKLPKTASRSFVEGYIESLRTIVADSAPGYKTVAPAFAPPDPDKNNSMSDYTDTMKAKDDGSFLEVRKELADKLDRDNASGQSRGDQSIGINGPSTDVEGWKGKNSNFDLSQVHTAALAREIARRSNI